ncbi:MAG: YlbF family regulator [Clostridia bacterium]|nr:YlbF family regulator [Clostridia bacterium]
MERTEIIAFAEKVGEAIKDSELMKAYEEAEKKYSTDEALQTKIREYSIQQQVLAEETAKNPVNEFLVESIQKRLYALYETITADETFVEFSQKQDAVRGLLTEVNNKIMQVVTGEDPNGGCTHDCSTCSGCH